MSNERWLAVGCRAGFAIKLCAALSINLLVCNSVIAWAYDETYFYDNWAFSARPNILNNFALNQNLAARQSAGTLSSSWSETQGDVELIGDGNVIIGFTNQELFSNDFFILTADTAIAEVDRHRFRFLSEHVIADVLIPPTEGVQGAVHFFLTDPVTGAAWRFSARNVVGTTGSVLLQLQYKTSAAGSYVLLDSATIDSASSTDTERLLFGVETWKLANGHRKFNFQVANTTDDFAEWQTTATTDMLTNTDAYFAVGGFGHRAIGDHYNKYVTIQRSEPVSYFQVTHPGTIYVDQGAYAEVTVTAKDADGDTVYNHDSVTIDNDRGVGTVSLVAGTGSLTDNSSDNGQASYTFPTTDLGTFTFGLFFPDGVGYSGFGASGEDFDIQIQHLSFTTSDNDSEGPLTLLPSPPSHYVITHDGDLDGCTPESITFTINDATGNTFLPYTYLTTISTGSGAGDWVLVSGNGVFNNGTSDDGDASYTFTPSDMGTVTLGLTFPSMTTPSGSVDIDAAYAGGISDDDSHSPLTLSSSGTTATEVFNHLITAEAITGDPVTWPSFSETQVAGSNFTIYQTTVSSCTDTISGNGTINAEYWVEYVDPPTGTVLPTIGGVAVGADQAGQVQIPFSVVDGEGSAVANYNDVGIIKIHYNADNGVGAELTASTGNFVVRPNTLEVDVPSNPIPVDHTSAAFAAAGDNFDVDVIARTASGDVAANFGNETSVLLNTAASTVVTAPVLVAPAGGTLDPLLTTGAFSQTASGTITGQFAFTEGGIIKLQAQLVDYMGGGDTLTSAESDNVGLFVPAKFTSDTHYVTHGCHSGGFGYLGEAMNVGFKLRPEASISTYYIDNYIDDYATFDFSDIDNYNLAVINDINGTPTDLTARIINFSPTAEWDAPTTTFLMQLDFAISRQASAEGPYDNVSIGHNMSEDYSIHIASTELHVSDDLDTDNSGSTDTKSISITDLRYGRLFLSNKNGSKADSLTIPVQAQYWDGTSYALNSDDSCSTFAPSLTYHSPMTAGDFETGCFATDGGTSVSLGLSAILLEKPVADCALTATGPDKVGTIEVEAVSNDWLRFDYYGSGDVNPKAQASFGIFSGSDPVIFKREVR